MFTLHYTHLELEKKIINDKINAFSLRRDSMSTIYRTSQTWDLIYMGLISNRCRSGKHVVLTFVMYKRENQTIHPLPLTLYTGITFDFLFLVI